MTEEGGDLVRFLLKRKQERSYLMVNIPCGKRKITGMDLRLQGMVKVFVRVEFRRIRRQIKYLYPLWGGADQRPDLRQLVVPSPQGGVEVIAIGNPPLLPHSYKRAAVRSDFPPLRTVHATFTAHGAPSMQIICCVYVKEPVFSVRLIMSSVFL